jgi:hypothetical protein
MSSVHQSVLVCCMCFCMYSRVLQQLLFCFCFCSLMLFVRMRTFSIDLALPARDRDCDGDRYGHRIFISSTTTEEKLWPRDHVPGPGSVTVTATVTVTVWSCHCHCHGHGIFTCRPPAIRHIPYDVIVCVQSHRYTMSIFL